MADVKNPVFKVKKAKRLACKAAIMLEGLTGTGKSGLALALARGLTDDWDEVGCIDTENLSAQLFVGLDSIMGDKFGEFLYGDLDPETGFRPTNYIAWREAMIKEGAKAVIFDSISHAWQYKGGILDMVAEAKTKNAHYAKDKYAVWGDEEVVKEKNELLQLIRDRRVHMITTVRVKEKMEYVDGEKGKELRSLGEQQIQQADLKYEPDLVIHMLRPGYVDPITNAITYPYGKIIKTRYAILVKDQEYEFTPELIKQIRQYLEEGTSPEELLEQQRQDYILATKNMLDSKPGLKAIWDVLKKDAGLEKTKLTDIPLDSLKQLYIKLTTD